MNANCFPAKAFRFAMQKAGQQGND